MSLQEVAKNNEHLARNSNTPLWKTAHENVVHICNTVGTVKDAKRLLKKSLDQCGVMAVASVFANAIAELE